MMAIVLWIWELFMGIDSSEVEVILALPKGKCVVKVCPTENVVFCLLPVWFNLRLSF
mgnify:CR=1 FL=1